MIIFVAIFFILIILGMRLTNYNNGYIDRETTK